MIATYNGFAVFLSKSSVFSLYLDDRSSTGELYKFCCDEKPARHVFNFKATESVNVARQTFNNGDDNCTTRITMTQ